MLSNSNPNPKPSTCSSQMSALPDELWRRILELGIQRCGLTYKDLCCISITSRRLRRLSSEDPLWSHLLLSDYPTKKTSSTNHSCKFSPSSSSNSVLPCKSLYKLGFQRDKKNRRAAHRRAVLRKESQIAEHFRKLQEIETRLTQETSKMKETAAELKNLFNARQASVALNVWQPEVIRDRQKQIVKQSAVPAESRIQALNMELRLCRQQIIGLEKSYRDERRRLDTAKEELKSIKYHPLQELKSVSGGENESNSRGKKLKRCNNCAASVSSIEAIH